MATYTDAEMLEKVREAIYTIMDKGKSYSINGRTYTRQDLTDLADLETRYQKRVDNAAGRSTLFGAYRRPQ